MSWSAGFELWDIDTVGWVAILDVRVAAYLLGEFPCVVLNGKPRASSILKSRSSDVIGAQAMTTKASSK